MDYVQGPGTPPWTPAWNVDFRPGLDGVSGHLTQALEARRRAHEMGAIFGGRMPSPHTYIPGGFTSVPKSERINEFRGHLRWLIDFIRNVYIPDVETLSTIYPDYFSIGKGCRKLLAFGVFDLDESGNNKLLSGGIAKVSKRPTSVRPFFPDHITESVSYSWYDDSTDNLEPFSGVTEPIDPLNKEMAYSWLKAPRYRNRPFEVGPLARMWVNGDYRNGASVMDRHLARAYEALKVAQAMDEWLDELSPGHSVYNNHNSPVEASGIGLTEAPRGALGHWVEIIGGGPLRGIRS